MTKISPTTVVGIFEDRCQAEAAFVVLLRGGFDTSQIGVAARGTSPPDAGTAAAHS